MKTAKELRKFGITMAVAFLALGGLALWRDKSIGGPLVVLGAVFAVAALVYPPVLRPVEYWWMKFAHVLGAVMTTLLLTLTFFLVITPMGLLLRLLGKDPLALKHNPSRTSYWIKVEADGPSSRPDKPY